MEAIVLAGGRGTRLRPVVSDLPKVMAPISGRPFLEFLLDRLAISGVRHVLLSVGYKASAIIDYFGVQYAGMDLTYVTEDFPLGTGGAVRLALDSLQGDHAFVLNGDTYLDLEFCEVEALWRERKTPIIVGASVPDVSRYGTLRVNHGTVVGFEEKNASGPGVINAGAYVFSRDQLSSFPLHQPFSLEVDYLAKTMNNHTFAFFQSRAQFIDIGIPEDFEKCQRELAPKPYRPALFLDRDGVINYDKGYVFRPEDIEFVPGIFDVVRHANKMGWYVVVVTNQAGIARGYYTESQFYSLVEWIKLKFSQQNAKIDAVYHSPCHPEFGIGEYLRDDPCRKPRPGMFLKAKNTLGIDMEKSVMIGDKEADMQAAKLSGVGTRLFLGDGHSESMTRKISHLSEALKGI